MGWSKGDIPREARTSINHCYPSVLFLPSRSITPSPITIPSRQPVQIAWTVLTKIHMIALIHMYI
jgi:hypothetical protein